MMAMNRGSGVRRARATLGASVTFVLVACAGKVDRVGGESHFVCMSDHDCPASQPVCVKADSESTRGECRPAGSGGAGTTAGPADASTDQSVGGSGGGGNASGSGGSGGSNAGGSESGDASGAGGGSGGAKASGS